jgi:mono/diheme cytochrome c family protein
MNRLLLSAPLALLVAACGGTEDVVGQPDATRGRALFEATCAGCHGADGNTPTVANAPSLWSALVQRNTDETLAASIKNGKGSGMPAFGGTYSDAQILDIVAHLRTLGR